MQAVSACFVYDSQPINEVEPENDIDRTEDDKVVKDCELSQLAQEFVARVPKYDGCDFCKRIERNDDFPSYIL
jgi:hypothetical protein